MSLRLSEFMDELIERDKDKVLYYLKLILYFFKGESVVFMNLFSSFRKRLHNLLANVWHPKAPILFSCHVLLK
jgi:hypothetical protein